MLGSGSCKHYRTTHIPTLCTLIFAELGVLAWDLNPRATILKSNERALKYNKMLGFKVIEDDPEKEDIDSGLMDIISLGLDHSLIKAHESENGTEIYYL